MRVRPAPLSCLLFLTSAGYVHGDAIVPNADAYRTGPTKSGGGCTLQLGGESAVVAILGPQTLKLADGRFIRLAEVLTPSRAVSPDTFDPSAAPVSYLRETVLGKRVEVRFGGAQRDRYGVSIAHVFLAEPRIWVQEGLVRAGLAVVYPQPDNHACFKDLLKAEQAARTTRAGHWGLSYFKVLNADYSRPALNLLQTYQIVEGNVTGATQTGNRTALTFGKDRNWAFTVTLDASARKGTKARDLSLDAWAGRSVRVRGWIEKKRNPGIAVVQPEQLEFLDVPGSSRFKASGAPIAGDAPALSNDR